MATLEFIDTYEQFIDQMQAEEKPILSLITQESVSGITESFIPIAAFKHLTNKQLELLKKAMDGSK